MTPRLWKTRQQRFLARWERRQDAEEHFVQATIDAARHSARGDESFPPIGMALAREHWEGSAGISQRPGTSGVAIISAVLGVASLGVAGAVPAPVHEAVGLMARGIGVELPPRPGDGNAPIEYRFNEEAESEGEPATSTTVESPTGTTTEVTVAKSTTTSAVPTSQSPPSSSTTTSGSESTTTSSVSTTTTTTASSSTTSTEPQTTTTTEGASSANDGHDHAAGTEGGGGAMGTAADNQPDPDGAADDDGAGGQASEGASDGSASAASQENDLPSINLQLQPVLAAFVPRVRGLLVQRLVDRD